MQIRPETPKNRFLGVTHEGVCGFFFARTGQLPDRITRNLPKNN
jgi:hypothetical protein